MSSKVSNLCLIFFSMTLIVLRTKKIPIGSSDYLIASAKKIPFRGVKPET